MAAKRYFTAFCILQLVMISSLFADTFTVTSTADSGPGTLRQAILDANANGTATTDFIVFNISSTTLAGRTIVLQTGLPALSSNLVIDGSTQPGLPFAVTDAKVVLKKDDYAPEFTLFTLTNVTNIKIYGLYMFYGYWQGLFGPPYRADQLYAIKLDKAFDIQIGAPGKGNVINGYNYAIYSRSDSCRNIRIQSNYMGQGLYYSNPADDIDQVVLSVQAAIEMLNAKDVLIGGPTVAEGNVIKAGRAVNLDSRYEKDNGFIKIQNNVFGKSYDRTIFLGGQDFWNPNLYIGENWRYLGFSTRPSMDYEVQVLDNEIPTSMGIAQVSKKIIVKGNHFDVPSNIKYGDNYSKLFISNCADGEIGGNTDAEKNTFRFGQNNLVFAITAYDNGPVTITKNNFQCNTVNASPTIISSTKTLVPFVQIDNTTATRVSGIATPNCTIELFYDDECLACEGKVFLGITQSDAQGNWSYNSAITGTVVATATTGNGTTGQFSTPETDISRIVVKQPTCGQNNGSITGLTIKGADGCMWQDRNGNVLSNSLDLLNVGPGDYTFYAKLGNACIKYGAYYQLEDLTPKIIDTINKTIRQPTCGNNNGAIENIRITGISRSVIEWQNDQGLTFTGEINGAFVSLRNLYPGSYRLFIRDTTGADCKDSTFFYELANQAGPVMHINNMVIAPAGCNNNDGSITNIATTNVTGTPFIQWVDSLNRAVGNSFNLLNKPAGKYRLKFKDEGSCDTLFTPYFIIPSNGFIQLDSAAATVTHANCAVKGSVTGMKITGATGAHWIDINSGTVVSPTPDLLNVNPGSYRLVAENTTYNCTAQSHIYTIRISLPVVNDNQLQIKPDTCNLSVGTISGLVVASDKPVRYQWYTENNHPLSTAGALTNTRAGKYYLTATDADNCSVSTELITVGNYQKQIAPPVYDNVTIPKGASITLIPKNATGSTYLLFSTSTSPTPVQQNNTGQFTTGDLFNDVTYYVAVQTGECISSRTPVTVKVVDETKIMVPNAFTPNNDQHNGTWGIRVIGVAKLVYLRVFNRWGQIVFETADIDHRWNGTFKGKNLPSGTYSWVLQAVDYFGKPIKQKGSVTILY